MEYNLIRTERPVYNLAKFQEAYPSKASDGVKRQDVRAKMQGAFKKYLKPSKSCLGAFMLHRLPFINLFRNYKLNYLLKDFVSGLTVGVIQIAPSYILFSLLNFLFSEILSIFACLKYVQ